MRPIATLPLASLPWTGPTKWTPSHLRSSPQFLRVAGLVSVARLRAFRRYFVLVGAVGAAVITPPDPWTMMLALGPLILLYEVGILAVWFFERSSATEDPDSPDEEHTA